MPTEIVRQRRGITGNRKPKPRIDRIQDDLSHVGLTSKIPDVDFTARPDKLSRNMVAEFGREEGLSFVLSAVNRMIIAGARKHQIAQHFDVDLATVNLWRKQIKSMISKEVREMDYHGFLAEMLNWKIEMRDMASRDFHNTQPVVVTTTTNQNGDVVEERRVDSTAAGFKLGSFTNALRAQAQIMKYLEQVKFYDNGKMVVEEKAKSGQASLEQIIEMTLAGSDDDVAAFVKDNTIEGTVEDGSSTFF